MISREPGTREPSTTRPGTRRGPKRAHRVGKGAAGDRAAAEARQLDGNGRAGQEVDPLVGKALQVERGLDGYARVRAGDDVQLQFHRANVPPERRRPRRFGGPSCLSLCGARPQMVRTLTAFGPLSPASDSYSTRALSASER